MNLNSNLAYLNINLENLNSNYVYLKTTANCYYPETSGLLTTFHLPIRHKTVQGNLPCTGV